MFLTGTLLNVATVLIGTTLGVLAGSRIRPGMADTLTTGLGLFTAVIGLSMGLRIFTDPAVLPGDDLALLGGLLGGAVIGELGGRLVLILGSVVASLGVLLFIVSDGRAGPRVVLGAVLLAMAAAAGWLSSGGGGWLSGPQRRRPSRTRR